MASSLAYRLSCCARYCGWIGWSSLAVASPSRSFARVAVMLQRLVEERRSRLGSRCAQQGGEGGVDIAHQRHIDRAVRADAAGVDVDLNDVGVGGVNARWGTGCRAAPACRHSSSRGSRRRSRSARSCRRCRVIPFDMLPCRAARVSPPAPCSSSASLTTSSCARRSRCRTSGVMFFALFERLRQLVQLAHRRLQPAAAPGYARSGGVFRCHAQRHVARQDHHRDVSG